VEAFVFGVDPEFLTHTSRVADWRDAFTTIANQHDTGAINVAVNFR
jgi:hypothetical protein